MRNGAIPVYHPGMALLFSLIPVHSLRIVCMVHNQLGEQTIKMTGFCCIPYGNQTSSRWYLRFPTAIKQTAAVPLQNNTANSFPANDRHRSFP